MEQSLYSYMKQCACNDSNKCAIAFYGKRYSYKKVLELTDRLAYSLKAMGIRVGDVVTVCLPNTPAAVIVFYAINKLGAVVNLVHPYIPPAALAENMERTLSKVLVAYDIYLAKNGPQLKNCATIIMSRTGDFMGGAARLVYNSTNKNKIDIKTKSLKKLFRKRDKSDFYKFRNDEPAVYMPSGGTTGEPKIIMHNCKVLNELASHAQFFLAGDISDYKSMYSVLPIFHGFGLCMNMHLCMTQGITNVMSVKFDPARMAKEIAKEKVAVLTGVPTMYAKLLDSKAFRSANISSLRECFVGGDSAPQSLVEDFNKLLKERGSKGGLYEGYGLTETLTVCAVTNSKYYKPQSVGYPLPNTKVAIIKNNQIMPAGEIGEICVSTPIRMLGYYQSDDSPFKVIGGEEWLFTGDYGHVDADGFIFFKQRIKNIIKVNGVPVFPTEIEELIEKLQGVKRAAAVGVPDAERGQIVKVIVEPEIDADKEKLKKEISQTCAKNLMTYAQPKKIEFRDSLPVNAIGKIDRAKLG